jgi:hypothetical protein
VLYHRIETADAFHKAVVFGQTAETRHLEFKATFDWQSERRDEQADHAARDIAQFANTEGGVLLVGVSEREGPNGQRVADGVVPVQDLHGLTGWLEQTIRNHLDPATFSHSIIAVDTGKGTVLAVNVDPSLHLVALWHRNDRHGIEYLYRTNHGNAWMNPGEVERHLMNSSRAMQLTLASVFAKVGDANPIEVTPLVHEMRRELVGSPPTPKVPPVPSDKAEVYWSEPTEHGVTLRVRGIAKGGTPVTLPTGLVREAWVTANGRAGLCLGVRIVVSEDGRFYLDPL